MYEGTTGQDGKKRETQEVSGGIEWMNLRQQRKRKRKDKKNHKREKLRHRKTPLIRMDRTTKLRPKGTKEKKDNKEIGSHDSAEKKKLACHCNIK